MVELRERPGLGQVLLDVLRPGDPLGVGDLDGDRSVELVVAGEVDPPETALAEPPDHAVAADRRGVALRAPKSKARIPGSPRVSRPRATVSFSRAAGAPGEGEPAELPDGDVRERASSVVSSMHRSG